MYGDLNRIKQIFRNLIGNSIKFTEKGKVHSRLKLNEISDSKIKIEFEVSDTGIGIKEEVIKDIFKPYNLIEEKKKSGILSTCLGLSITKEMVNLMNGEITATSNFGYGSTFSFFIILDKGEKTLTQKQITYKKLKGSGSILLAEDNKVNQLLIKKIINDWNIKITIANNGLEVLDILKNNNFDLILMDAEMPEMGGLETSERIRKLKSNYSQIPIIFLSANKFNNENILKKKYGISHFITKPYNLTVLSDAINNFIKLS